MKWVTRAHVHVDRVACPWLITRFVDSDAEFLFVAASEVEAVAKREGAIPFDAPGIELGHHGSECSFEAIMLSTASRTRRSSAWRRSSTPRTPDHLDADPIAAGLEAIATGYGLRYPDDLENLSRQFEVYDALYAWCRLEMAKSETR